MPVNCARPWHRLFLEERPSIGLSLFRITIALATGLHVIPTLLQLQDNYLSTACKTINPSFFPLPVLQWVAASPDAVVYAVVALFLVSWCAFLIGLWTQRSAIAMLLSCYYFYALNSLHIGTLSWDILLVTLVLMCVTPYPGDYFSVDSLRRGDPQAYRRTRPYFVQRLLQIQIAAVFFFTGLNKIVAGGNWLRANPIASLVHAGEWGVVKEFWGRAWLAQHAGACYAIGLTVIACELLMPLLLFARRTRRLAIGMGCIFHVLLVLTLHVPTLFFFHFPPQLCLFIDPRELVAWIDRRRAQRRRHGILIFDGHCGFCQASVRQVQTVDLWGYVRLVDYHTHADLRQLHPSLDLATCHGQLHLVEPGRLSGGFAVFQRLSVRLPLLWPIAPVLHLPGMAWVGGAIYRWVAVHRYLFSTGTICADNHCALHPPINR